MGGKILKLKSEELYELGEANGEARGEARGKAKTLVENVDTLMKSLSKTLEETCLLLGTTMEAYMSAKALLSKQD